MISWIDTQSNSAHIFCAPAEYHASQSSTPSGVIPNRMVLWVSPDHPGSVEASESSNSSFSLKCNFKRLYS